jgi:hypothetical protein
VISQQWQLNLLLAAIPEKILDQIKDVVDKVPKDFPYDLFNAHFLEAQTLSDQEKMDVLFKSVPLGGQKPSQMLANMLAYCPSHMEPSIMFQYLFLQRLLVTLQTLLGKQEPGDIRSLAVRADKLWATHKHQPQDLVATVDAAVEQPAAQIVAVWKEEPPQKRFAWKKPGGQPPAGRGGQAASGSSS